MLQVSTSPPASKAVADLKYIHTKQNKTKMALKCHKIFNASTPPYPAVRGGTVLAAITVPLRSIHSCHEQVRIYIA